MQFQPTDLREQPLCPHTTSSQAALAPCPAVPAPSSGPTGWAQQGLASLAAVAGLWQTQPAAEQPPALSTLMPLVPLPTALAGWAAWARPVLAVALSSQALPNPQHASWGAPGLAPNWSSDPEGKAGVSAQSSGQGTVMEAGRHCGGGGNTCAGITGPFPTCSPCPWPMTGQHGAGTSPAPSSFPPFQPCPFSTAEQSKRLGQAQVFSRAVRRDSP